MALKILMKPGERMIIGGAVVANAGSSSCELLIENRVPVLRKKEILSEKEADTPCKRIYFLIQLMYVDGSNVPVYHQRYWEKVKEVVEAAPSLRAPLEEISREILAGDCYAALKKMKPILLREKEMMRNAEPSLSSL